VNVEELEKHVILMEDIQEIEDLQKRYGYYFDTQKYQEVVDLFSDDAESVEIESCGLFVGKAGVKRMYVDCIGSKRYESWVQFRIQMIGGVVDVDPGGKTAKGRWQTWLCEAMPVGGVPRQQWLHGYYANEFVKENGKWLFRKLHWNVTFYTSFEAGWVRIPLLGLLTMAMADGPPTAFHPYPYGYHVPYPYKHPITGK
jgi:hypothetical protein